MRAGAIPPLVHLLKVRCGRQAHIELPTTRVWHAVFCLCADGSRSTCLHAAAVLSRRLIPPHPLPPPPPHAAPAQEGANSEGCRQEAARALSNLSCNNDAGQATQMVDLGAVPLLVSMMRVGGVVPILVWRVVVASSWVACCVGAAIGLTCSLCWCQPLPACKLLHPCLLPGNHRLSTRVLPQASGPAGQEAAVGAVSNLACIRPHQQVILDVSLGVAWVGGWGCEHGN